MVIIEDVRCELFSSKILVLMQKMKRFSILIKSTQKIIDLIEDGQLEGDYDKIMKLSNIPLLMREMRKTEKEIKFLEDVMYN